MIKVIYIFKDGSESWSYEVRKLRTAVEAIREDMEEIGQLAKADVLDENWKENWEVKR